MRGYSVHIKVVDLLKYLSDLESKLDGEAAKGMHASRSKEWFKGASYATNTIKNSFIELLHENSKDGGK